MSSPKVSILVVGYNTRSYVLECLASVYEHVDGVDFEVIVVDNASADDSADAIAERFPQARLIRSAENLGFAGANNLAAEQAGGEYLLLLNPDTVLLDDCVSRVVAFADANPHAGIWGGRTLFGDGSLNPTSCWQRATLWSTFCRSVGLSMVFRGSRLFDPEAMGTWKRDSVRQVDIVTGCFLLIRAELWRRLGGFDLAFFMYGEEVDLCLRAHALGFRPMITPEATLVHHGGSSEPVLGEKLVRLLRAKVELMKRHWSPWKARLGAALLALSCWNRYAGGRVLRSWGVSVDAEKARGWGFAWQHRDEWSRGY